MFELFSNYQKAARSTAIYPNIGNNLSYPLLGLFGEAGEVCEKVKKIYRDNNGEVTDDKKELLRKECGDVLWYVAALCSELAIDMGTIAQKRNVRFGVSAELDELALRLGVQAAFISNYLTEDVPLNRHIPTIDGRIYSIIFTIEQIAVKYLDCSLSDIMEENIKKLLDRQDRGKLQGSGDTR